MPVDVQKCGAAANESEKKSIEALRRQLLSSPELGDWILLTNLMFSVNQSMQADEIDIVAIGPPGVRLIEVKHWMPQRLDDQLEVGRAADILTQKAKKVASTLQNARIETPFVKGVILLSQEPSIVKRYSGKEVRGVQLLSLNEWQEALGTKDPPELSAQMVKRVAEVLKQRMPTGSEGSLRRMAGYVNLERISPPEERFHRVFKGKHGTRRDKVILHLYDLSAKEDKNAEEIARREFQALQTLRRFKWSPGVLDSFQDVPGFSGEMFYFTVEDPEAPTMQKRASDSKWQSSARIDFARAAIHALVELHAIEVGGGKIVHRNLSPVSLLVRGDNTPFLTNFHYSRLPEEVTIVSSNLPTDVDKRFVAPEVARAGLSAADQRSDVYALCATLATLFEGRDDSLSSEAMRILQGGIETESAARAELGALAERLSLLLGDVEVEVPIPPVRYWTENQDFRFGKKNYRILLRLGSGGIGTAFKVVEMNQESGEELGVYVAKVVEAKELGERVLLAYSRARSHLVPPTMSTIYEIADEWRENHFVALMKWVPGSPLSDWIGMLPLLAEEQQEASTEEFVLRWLREICRGLEPLHTSGLIHGDISPRNLIIDQGSITLTDYDLVSKIGDVAQPPGVLDYCSLERERGAPVSASDDLYALAATFFHVLFERLPFRSDGNFDKSTGIHWQGVDRTALPRVAGFLERATHPDPSQRIASVSEAIAVLDTVPPNPVPVVVEEPRQLSEQHVQWLSQLLYSYPGSRMGNRETRGLDTDFAALTYVETELEERLLRDIRDRAVRLVILCGNAGDGKTALLQHLAQRLELGKQLSSQRILQGQVPGGPLVRMNLDGSAAWQGKSADDLLDDFLAPFQNGAPAQDIVHLLAINDGRLLEWVEQVQGKLGTNGTSLTRALEANLQGDSVEDGEHIRFITLNQRSLVGGANVENGKIETHFLDRLIDSLFGGENAQATWTPCLSCSAKMHCEVFRTVLLFGPSDYEESAPGAQRARARQRLHEVLQAVHLSGETHITMRELRSALVYILFGLYECSTYHKAKDIELIPYWDRAFNANSTARQGEVLAALVRLDPALEANPQIDRLLQSEWDNEEAVAPGWPLLPLASARRRAYFEWLESEVEAVARDARALNLARSKHLAEFRDLPFANAAQRASVRDKLCNGIANLEDLPPQAHKRTGVVPLRITPRTPTETAFWVEKPLDRFEVEAVLPPSVEGIEVLHRQVVLRYHYEGTQRPETLIMGAELFHLLMELAEGYQLGDSSTDESFANLSVFVQRLVREDERELLAWSPMQDEKVFRVFARIDETESGPLQRMVIEEGGVTS